MKTFNLTNVVLLCTFVWAVGSFAQEKHPDDPTIIAPGKTSRPSRPFIGIQVADTDEATGVRIVRVIPGTPADKAGLLLNDVITKIGEVETSDQPALLKAKGQYGVGDRVDFSIRRAEKEIVVELTFADAKNDALPANQRRLSKPQMKPETIAFPSNDGLEISAEVYIASSDKKTPLIVLCHQAGWSRGEYREIAPRLVALGFNCMAIDQRSGDKVNDAVNWTNRRAAAAKKDTSFVAAEQDMLAAIKWARENLADDKLILWGSSYSAALALRIAGENASLVDGVLAFAPGEYFLRLKKPDDWITTSAKKIEVPTFITSAKKELPRWEAIYNAIPGETKTKFVPETEGNHGSRALWAEFDDSADYWKQVEAFLAQFK